MAPFWSQGVVILAEANECQWIGSKCKRAIIRNYGVLDEAESFLYGNNRAPLSSQVVAMYGLRVSGAALIPTTVCHANADVG